MKKALLALVLLLSFVACQRPLLCEKDDINKVAILGLGHVGLPTAVITAEHGYTVLGFDTDTRRMDRIKMGDPAIVEPEIVPRLAGVLKNKNFSISSELQSADCFIIAVSTSLNEDHTTNLTNIFAAAEQIAKRIKPGNLVILASTVPVGTTDRVAQRIAELSGLEPEVEFFTAYCPERILPTRIFKELVENDRVFGGCSQHACDRAIKFYRRFVRGIIHTTANKSAEMVKLIENSSRYIQIAFANQVAEMCADVDIDPYRTIELANSHPRVNVLSPTCGVGGGGVSTDPWLLIESFPKATRLLRIAREINDAKPSQVLAKIMRSVEKFTTDSGKKPTVLVMGVTFKPDVDDLRESPALKITLELIKKQPDLHLLVHDPVVLPEDLERIKLPSVQDLALGIEQADIIVVLVKHRAFIQAGMGGFGKPYAFIDTCGLLHEIAKNSVPVKLKKE